MNKKNFQSFFGIAVFFGIWSVLVNCGPSASKHDLFPSSTTRAEKMGALLFVTTQTPAQIEAEKNRFLTSPVSNLVEIPDPTPGIPSIYFDTNMVRPHVTAAPATYDASVPFLHTYHGVQANAIWAIRLPDAFRWNLPSYFRDELKYYDINHLDLYVVVQRNGASSSSYCLKPGFWLFGDLLHQLRSGTGAPPQYQGTVEMMLDLSDFNIDHQVQTRNLLPFDFSLHDNLVSPDTGHINIPIERTVSFFSLIIYEKAHKAAVTLHWSLSSGACISGGGYTPQDANPFIVFLRTQVANNLDQVMQNASPLHTLPSLSGAQLQTSPMFQKLHHWLYSHPVL